MRTEEFISSISGISHGDERFIELKRGLPIGLDSAEEIVLSQKRKKPCTTRGTFVTGVGKEGFILRLMITMSCLYESNEASFLVLSPNAVYSELLRLKNIDVTVPYVRTKTDLDMATQTLRELLLQREFGKGYPHLFIVLDGLEELPECNQNGDLAEYRELLDMFIRREDVDVICGAELMKSIFRGYPGAFVGIGNCLITLRENGKADVTYVGEDASLSLPTPIVYPNTPSISETVIYLNTLNATVGEMEELYVDKGEI